MAQAPARTARSPTRARSTRRRSSRTRSSHLTDPGPSTRAVHAGRRAASQGDPFSPPVVLAAPYHLSGPADPSGYGRYVNPTWTALEAALGELEGGPCLVFGSGMAAISAVLSAVLSHGDRVVLPSDGYYTVRGIVGDHDPVFVPSRTEAVVEAVAGARLVWVETPANPLLGVVDIAAVAAACRDAGALLAVDNTVATPLGQRPLALGADFSVTAGTKSLAGHSDLLYGVVAARDAALLEPVLGVRSRTGAILGPFEAWLAHRSLATLDLRLERASATALELCRALSAREDVASVHHPSLDPMGERQMARLGSLVSFDVGTEDRAQEFFASCALVAEATSFGGVHTTAERRARWGTDAVGPGLIRLSAGIEDTADVVADVLAALDATR